MKWITVWNQLKGQCLDAISQACGKVEVTKPDVTVLGKYLTLSTGSNDDGDIMVNLNNPIFKDMYTKLDDIGQLVVQLSSGNVIQFAGFKIPSIKGRPLKALTFFIKRETFIPYLLDSKSSPSLSSESKEPGSVLIINLAEDEHREWSRYRMTYVAECLAKLCELKYQKVKYMTIKDIESMEKFCSDMPKEDEAIQAYYKKERPDPNPKKRFINYLKLFPNVLTPDNDYQLVHVVINLNDKQILDDAFAILKLSAISENILSKVSLFTVADAVSENNFEQVSTQISTQIKDQCRSTDKEEYSPETLATLVDFCLRYQMISTATPSLGRLNASKNKDSVFVQYNHARLSKLIAKFNSTCDQKDTIKIDYSLLVQQAEWEMIIQCLLKAGSFFDDFQKRSFSSVHQMVGLLDNIANKISVFYNSVRIITELNEKTLPLAVARVELVKELLNLLKKFVHLMHAEAVENI